MTLILAVRLRHYLAMPAIATSALDRSRRRRRRRQEGEAKAGGPGGSGGDGPGAATRWSDRSANGGFGLAQRGLAGPMGGQVTVEVPTPSTSLTQF